MNIEENIKYNFSLISKYLLTKTRTDRFSLTYTPDDTCYKSSHILFQYSEVLVHKRKENKLLWKRK